MARFYILKIFLHPGELTFITTTLDILVNQETSVLLEERKGRKEKTSFGMAEMTDNLLEIK